MAETLQPQVSVLKGEKNFWSGYDPVNVDGTVNVVIEIAAGTTAKYMVELKSGMIELEQKNGAPRYVQYLGYPCNYGNIPRSVLLKSKGGDGDAVDALVLGPSVPTGSVVRGRAIGMLSLMDTGEKDDKVVVVMENTPFFSVRSIDELDRKFPGVTTILQTWFTSYKGRDKDGKLLLCVAGLQGPCRDGQVHRRRRPRLRELRRDGRRPAAARRKGQPLSLPLAGREERRRVARPVSSNPVARGSGPPPVRFPFFLLAARARRSLSSLSRRQRAVRADDDGRPSAARRRR